MILEVFAPAALSDRKQELMQALEKQTSEFTDLTPEVRFRGAMVYVRGTAPRRVLERTDFALRRAMAEIRNQ